MLHVIYISFFFLEFPIIYHKKPTKKTRDCGNATSFLDHQDISMNYLEIVGYFIKILLKYKRKLFSKIFLPRNIQIRLHSRSGFQKKLKSDSVPNPKKVAGYPLRGRLWSPVFTVCTRSTSGKMKSMIKRVLLCLGPFFRLSCSTVPKLELLSNFAAFKKKSVIFKTNFNCIKTYF